MPPPVEDLEEQQWSPWIPIGAALLVVGTMAAAVYQRHSYYFIIRHGHVIRGHAPLAIVIAFAILAVSPFVNDCLSYPFPRLRGLPIWLFPIPVLIGVAYFVLHPTNIDFAPFVLVFMSAELASRAGDKPLLALGAPLASIGLMIGADLSGHFQGGLIWVIGILFGWFGGFLVQNLDRKTRELREAQAGLTEKAAADERSRIAREVHDVIAHSMSVTMLHITAARMALEKAKTSDALEALREAERQGRSSMADIRRTVGLLGPEGDAAAAPMPGVDDLPKLVSDFRHAGLNVTLDVRGDFHALAPAAGLSIYRITQESLTNVAKHAPGAAAHVELSIDDETIRLAVRNPSMNGKSPASDGSGLGIRGMVERAAVLDGTLVAGRTPDGWSVELTALRTNA